MPGLVVVVKLEALEVHAQQLRQRPDGCALDGRHALAQFFTQVGVVALHQLTLGQGARKVNNKT